MFESADVKHRANGGWPAILSTLCANQDLKAAIDRGPRGHGPCPMCGGTDRFRFTDSRGDGNYVCSPYGNGCGSGDGFRLLMELNGWTFAQAVNSIGEWLGIPENRDVVRCGQKVHKISEQKKVERRQYVIQQMNATWQEAIPCTDPSATPVRRYLVSRGLGGYLPDAPVLRFHPNIEYWHKEKPGMKSKLLGSYPALLSMVVTHEGKPVTLHRTFLTDDGEKAPVPKPKKVWSPHGASVTVRLHQPTDVLAVTEGLETAIAVHLAFGLPVWACLNAGGLANVEVPHSVSRLHIFADLDSPSEGSGKRAGTEAARLAAEKLADSGVNVSLHIPPGPIPSGKKGVDWLDIWNAKVAGDPLAKEAVDAASGAAQIGSIG